MEGRKRPWVFLDWMGRDDDQFDPIDYMYIRICAALNILLTGIRIAFSDWRVVLPVEFQRYVGDYGINYTVMTMFLHD